jgi:surfeit locus 1 family protein
MKITKSVFPKLAQVIAALLISLIFVELGIWQLHRAQDVQIANRTLPDKPIISLSKISSAGINLPPAAVNRIVKLRGHYVSTYSAPNQSISFGGVSKKVSLEVRLLKLTAGGAILVVRGLETLKSQSIVDEVVVTGRLYPRQNVDAIVPSSAGSAILSRIDPALVAGKTKLPLFDGYVVAHAENTSYGQGIIQDRVPTPQLKSKTAGFYWQHITYVFIWWLLALMVLLTPFYNRIKDRSAGEVRLRISRVNGDNQDKVDA